MSDEKKTTEQNLMGCFWGWLMLMVGLGLLALIGGGALWFVGG